MMIRPISVVAARTTLALFLVLLGSSETNARLAYLARVPNYPTEWHAIGHSHPNGGHDQLSPFGRDFSNLGDYQWTVQLCQFDSDGDGRTNGEELGDRLCEWKTGNPKTVVEYRITNPGVFDVFSPDDPFFLLNKSSNSTPPSSARTLAPFSLGPSHPKPKRFALPQWLVAHIVLGVLSIGVLIPLGTAMTSLLRRASLGHFKNLHVGLSTLAGLCALITMVLPLVEQSGRIHHPKAVHTITAILLFALLLLQSLTGVLMYFFNWNKKAHVLLARFAMFSMILLALGSGYYNVNHELDEISSKDTVVVWVLGPLHVLVVFLFWTAHEWHQYKRRAKYANNAKTRSKTVHHHEVDALESQDETLQEHLNTSRTVSSANSQAVEMGQIVTEDMNSMSFSNAAVVQRENVAGNGYGRVVNDDDVVHQQLQRQ